MREADIRIALLRHLEVLHAEDEDTLVVEEINVCQGLSRVDLAVVNSSLHGYEIKSQQDTLSRLPSQLRDYGLVFDAVTLVIGLKHLGGVLHEIPTWCGVMLASVSDDQVVLEPFRACRYNPNRDAYAMAQLLWRDEALDILTRHECVRGVKTKPRDMLWRRLADSLALDDLAAEVRTALRARKALWRADSRLRLTDPLAPRATTKRRRRRKPATATRRKRAPRRLSA